ncbi:MAG: DNA gyrase inhibitor YacG [Alphaproteobacteria bacterium]|nr:DNA gyrase inhibitor YacG [Alphaproteobacteria bacterium]
MGEVHKLDRRDRENKADEETGRKAAPCPICGKPSAAKTRPFCSTRCANIDLGRWLGGTYRVETDEVPEDGETPPPPDRTR